MPLASAMACKTSGRISGNLVAKINVREKHGMALVQIIGLVLTGNQETKAVTVFTIKRTNPSLNNTGINQDR